MIHWALSLAHRLTRRGSAPPILPWSSVGGALAALAVAWVCYGAALFALVAPLAGASGRAMVLSTGGFALAWTAGFVAAAVLVVADRPASASVRWPSTRCSPT